MASCSQATKESGQVPEPVVSFAVPLLPPSVNHYKTPYMARDRRTGVTRQRFVVSPEALAFKQAIAIFARGASISPQSAAEKQRVCYGLFVRLVLGKGKYGDGDNYWKCIADGLVDAGVIHSDARVTRWHLDVIENDRENERTEIIATVLGRR